MPDDIQSLIAQIARQRGVDPAIVLAAAQHESGFNPQAANETQYESSYGLFQENTMGGAGTGMSMQDLFDPVGSTNRFIDRLLQAMQDNPGADPGSLVVAAQRPDNTNNQYADAINGGYQQFQGFQGSGQSGGGGPRPRNLMPSWSGRGGGVFNEGGPTGETDPNNWQRDLPAWFANNATNPNRQIDVGDMFNQIGGWANQHRPLPGRGPLSGLLPSWFSDPFGGGSGGTPGGTNVPGAVAGPPSPTTSPADDPNDYRYWLNRLGKDAPFRNQQEFESWWQLNKDDAQLKNEYLRAQIAKMQKEGGTSPEETAHRNAQLQLQYAQLNQQGELARANLSQNALDSMVKMRSGPQDWAKYWYTSRGQTVPAGQESIPIEQALPPWAQFAGFSGRQTAPVLQPSPVTKYVPPVPATPAPTGTVGLPPDIIGQRPAWGQPS